ncbi:aminotransferase-like domain-containing protein [Streptomyces dubilierae]|uniref:PLP-dependent aminotransferase family protein n=1 Tax=Streptomyces dubilierae TaxID=3075533 RepID=A0ABU2P6H0_9ACTN|nr:PLP-dependent aminotransferase family protein [Streptomyces sp. DSM 41921]MDT0387747.1 PLP-dependent aminotransferase family protein [Streptomyces sp. DSM 41921]
MTITADTTGHAVALPRTALHRSLSEPLLDTMTFLNEVTLRYPRAVSFAPGRPQETGFDVADVPALIETYLDHLRARGMSEAGVRTALYQYGETAGQIRDLVAGMLRVDEDLTVDPAAVVVTVGCQEAVLLTLRALFTGPEDVLLVDSPCYVGITGAARLLGIDVVPVPGTAHGPDPEALHRIVRELAERGRRAKALYVVPDCSNPTGVSLSVEDRTALLDAARRLGLLLLEDNPYGVFSTVRRPTLKALDTTRSVIYLGSFAKIAFPGARVGFVVADQPVEGADGAAPGLLADELAKVKSMVTVNTATLSQAAVAGLLLRAGGGLREANEPAARHYQATMRALRDTLAHELPPGAPESAGVRWNDPDGGFFLTLDVPFDADEAALHRSAETYGVIWTPMRYFHLDDAGDRRIRLSCSAVTVDQAVDGARRLARFVQDRARHGDRA